MVATIDWMTRKFDEFNKKMFNSELIRPVFKLNTRRSSGGLCSWKYVSGTTRRIPGTRRRTADVLKGSESITLSTLYDIAEENLEDILIHEMIHLFFVQNNRPEVHHGTEFKIMMNRINRIHNRNINVRGFEADLNRNALKNRKTMKVYILFNNQYKKYLYMTCKTDVDGLWAVNELLERKHFEYIGYCLSDADMFQHRNSTIKKTGWSAKYFVSETEYKHIMDTAIKFTKSYVNTFIAG